MLMRTRASLPYPCPGGCGVCEQGIYHNLEAPIKNKGAPRYCTAYDFAHRHIDFRNSPCSAPTLCCCIHQTRLHRHCCVNGTMRVRRFDVNAETGVNQTQFLCGWSGNCGSCCTYENGLAGLRELLK